MKKAALHTLGCKVNAYETQSMEEMLKGDGYEIVPFSSKADVYVINTCTVTQIADQKSRQMIHRAKRENPDAVVIAAGCYAQTGEKVLKKDPDVDILLGNNKKGDLIKELHLYLKDHKEREDLIDINGGSPEALSYEEIPLTSRGDHTRAFIKVQDGCNQFCTYCLIPYARGRARSREMGDILREIRILAGKGYQEVVLTGIHLSSYGREFPYGLADLIEETGKIPGVKRIRLGSLEPEIVDEDFVKRTSQVDAFCPHFHLSLQSGCDRTLKRMNRHYTAEEYLNSLSLIRSTFPHPAITTDVIVGFPGETEDEFAESFAFCKKADFYETHVFKYSRRRGTLADRMPDQVPDEVKTKRSQVLRELAMKQALSFREALFGQERTVLFEEIEEIGGRPYWTGLSKEYVRMAIPSEGQGDLKNTFVTGRGGQVLPGGLVLLIP